MAKNLLGLVERRRAPISAKSKLVMNILPVKLPAYYFMCKSTASAKEEIYNSLKGKVTPPFLFTRNKEILTFADFDRDNPLEEYVQGDPTKLDIKDFQMQNPTFSSQLVNIHLRRIFWNTGVYRDPGAARAKIRRICPDLYDVRWMSNSSKGREILMSDKDGILIGC